MGNITYHGVKLFFSPIDKIVLPHNLLPPSFEFTIVQLKKSYFDLHNISKSKEHEYKLDVNQYENELRRIRLF